MPSHDLDNSQPDWEHYSVEELEQALAGLDRQQYPERVPIIQRLLEQRKLHPRQYEEVEHLAWNERPDWEHYSLDELNQALAGLDCHRYPDREEIIRALIKARGSTETQNSVNDQA